MPVEGLYRMGVTMGTAVMLNQEAGFFPKSGYRELSLIMPVPGEIRLDGNGTPNVPTRKFDLDFNDLVKGLGFTYERWDAPGNFRLGINTLTIPPRNCTTVTVEAGTAANVTLPDEWIPQHMGLELRNYPE